VLRVKDWFMPMLPLLAFAVLGTPCLLRSGTRKLILYYLAIAVVSGALMRAGEGVDQNALFDAEIALLIGLGIFLSHAPAPHDGVDDGRRVGPSPVLVAALLPVLFVAVPERLIEARTAFKYGQQIAAEVSEDVHFLATPSGPVACENLALCYWAGKGFEMDLFLTGQKVASGRVNERDLIELIGAHHFAVIQIDRQSGTTSRLPQRVNQKIRESYVRGRTSVRGGVFWVPRTSNSAARNNETPRNFSIAERERRGPSTAHPDSATRSPHRTSRDNYLIRPCRPRRDCETESS